MLPIVTGDVHDINRESSDILYTFAECFNKDFESVLPDLVDLLEPIPEESSKGLLDLESGVDDHREPFLEENSEHSDDLESSDNRLEPTFEDDANKCYFEREKLILNKFL